MSIKNLFGKSVTSYEDIAQDVESTDFIDEVVAKRETYLPPIDFSDPANFVFYGSAELYYEAAIKRIYEDYPYDGSKAEQIDFEEKSSFLERWLFENKYPKTTGHVEMGTTGNLTGTGFASTGTPEYIRVWGGLHTDSASDSLDYQLSNSAKYDEVNNRNQNWNCDFDKGATVEFWMQKDSFTAGRSEVVLDLWNGKSSGDPERGRVLLYVLESAGEQKMVLRVEKGPSVFQDFLNVASLDFTSWHQYSFSMFQNGSIFQVDFYIDGHLIRTINNSLTINSISGRMDGFIGSLFGDFGIYGESDGKLQASMDEFRFWKTKRTSRQIKLNWFREIGGGANTDDNTSDLGVYLKFNEGITGNTTIDSTVLDYSGRLANGTWIGYPGSAARSTDSAMTLSGYTEEPSPIIYSNHPDVAALEAEMTLSGSDYDSGRGQAFYRSLPNWLVEEDQLEGEENLRKISHILSSYMDTLRVQIDSLNKLQDKQYISASYKASPFASELLKNKGFTTSEMFLSAEVFETFSNIDYDHGQYDLNIDEIKNLIYTNIYNNLENIYNTKGTEKSIRNLIRCFGIDDELIKLNQYTDGGTQYLGDKYRTTSVKKKYINLNDPSHFDGTMYQSGTLTFISGASEASVAAFTMEADILVPYKKKPAENGYFGTPFLSASVMGFHEADPSDPADFTWQTTSTEARDLQVYLVRDSLNSDHAQFVLKNQSETIYVTSSFIEDIYENEHYNVALRIKPETYPYAGNVTNASPNYDIELYAVSHNFDELKEEILLSASVDNVTGSEYLQAPKRIYAGAHYQDFDVSVLQRTDLQFGRVSAWLDYLPNSSIQEHNKDVLNYGNNKSIDGSTAFAIDDFEIPSMELSILNWDFDTVTTSDGSGEFIIEDTTSGSSDTIYGWVDNIIRREHDGKGENFPISSTSFLSNEFLYANKKQLPETSFNANNIFIKGDQEINFGEDDDVSDNLFVLEKSPASIVSEEMLKLFSTTQEFSNLFGRHVDRYRIEYKDLARARQLFYQRVDTGLDFDKFFNYFKWIDQSISEMVNQLIPASVNFAGGVVDVIEPHILERDKYQRQVGLLQTVTSTEASIRGVQELNYNWRLGHAPRPLDTTTNSIWQKERTDSEITRAITRQTDQEFTNPINLSGSDGVYEGQTYATRRFSRPVQTKIEFANSIHGGTNYVKIKDRDLLRSGIGLHSDIAPSGAPRNIVTIGAGDGYGLNVDEVSKTQDQRKPSEKIRYDGFAILGKFTALNGVEYGPLGPDDEYRSRRKVRNIFPGNFVSSSVTTGYNTTVSASFRSGVNIVNLHSDTTDITNEIPIQGPFTERWIGGHQSRHTALNSVGKPRTATSTVPNDLDSQFSRPEAYRLVLGKNPLINSSSLGVIDPDADGAIGFTAPDYGIGSDSNFPDDQRLYSIYYREERAKRPVNIKNIQTLTSSVYHGNYQHEYEVMSTFGDQGYFLRRADNLLPDTISEALPQTTNYHTLIAQSSSVSGNYFGAENNRQYDSRTFVGGQTAAQATGGEFRVLGVDRVTPGHYIDIDSVTYEIDSSTQPGATTIPLHSTDVDFYNAFSGALGSNFPEPDFTVSYVETDVETSASTPGQTATGGGFRVLGINSASAGDFITIKSVPYEISTSVQGGETITLESTNELFYDGIKSLLESNHSPSLITTAYTEFETVVSPETASVKASGGGFRILGPDDVTDGHYFNIVSGSTTNIYEISSSIQGGSTIPIESTTTDFFDGVKTLLETDFTDFTVAYTPGDNGGDPSTPSQGISFLGGQLGTAGLEYSGRPSWSPASENTANIDPFTISFFINAPVNTPSSTGAQHNAMIYQGTRALGASGISVYLEADSSSGWHLVFVDVYANNGLSGGLVRTPKLWKYNDFIKGGTEYGGQLTHVIITSDGDRNPAPTVRLYINGSQESWDVTPSYGTGAHTSVELDGFFVGCNSAFGNFLSLVDDPTNGTMLDELMIFNEYFGSAGTSNTSIDEIYNNGNHLDYSATGSLTTFADAKALYTFSETGDGFDNGDTIHNAVAGAAEDLTVTDGTYTYSSVSYEKIVTSSAGAPSEATIIHHADFTIVPDNNGEYGNFTVNIPVVSHTSFSNTSDSTGGVDFVAAVVDSHADFTLTPTGTGSYANFPFTVGSGITFSNTSDSTGGVDFEAAVSESHADFTITPNAVGSYGNFDVNIPVATHTSFSNTQNSVDGLDHIAPSIIGGSNITNTQDRSTGSAHVVRTRFSAPGGPEINSSGYLDVASQQYSVHNSINFRNLTTRGNGSGESETIRVNSHSNRREGLRTLRSRHQGQFGVDSQHPSDASFHKQHRNTRNVAKLGDFVNTSWTTETLEIIDRHDNDHYHTPLPASDFQYSWINAAVSGSDWESNQVVLGYAPKNGIISSSSGIDSAINFPSSDLECFPCFDPEILTTSVEYLSKATSTTPSESSVDITLAAMLDNSSTPGLIIDGVLYSTIDDSQLNSISFLSTYSGCCDFSDLVFAIAVDGAVPSYASGTPTVPTLYFNQDCSVSLRYYVKQCTGKVDSITLNILNASVAEPVPTVTFEETRIVSNPPLVTAVTTRTASTDYYMQSAGSIHLGPLPITEELQSIVFGSQLQNFCCPDVTFSYRHKSSPLFLPSDAYTDVGTDVIQLNGTVFSHIGPPATSIGNLSSSPGNNVYFQVKVTDCNDNADIVQITINDAVLL